jgi:hypothetical protein
MDELRPIAPHPERRDRLRPQDARTFLSVDGQLEPVALLECPDQRLNVASNAGRVIIAERPGIERDAKEL